MADSKRDRDDSIDSARETIDCPYCREPVLAGASRCKHCGSSLEASPTAHGGECPYCREEIHPEALRCKHCGSWLAGSRGGDTPAFPQPGMVPPPDMAPVMSARQQVGVGGWNDRCMRSCQWSCGGAGLPSWYCWYACAWICSGGWGVGDVGDVRRG
jgi:DNA-directed RNA polymerase subunit RPC12/RpoP